MAIARVGSPVLATPVASVTSITFNVTCGSGTDLLYVSVVKGNSNTTATATYDGIAGTEVADTPDGLNLNSIAAYIWKASSLTIGVSKAVVITFSGTDDVAMAGAQCYSGVDQTTPNRTPATPTTGNSTTASITVANAQNTDLVVDVACGLSDNITMNGAQTSIWEDDQIAASGSVSGGASEKAATGSTTMTWTFAAAENWVIAAVALVAASGGGGETVTMDKWFPLAAPNKPRLAVPIASGIIGIRNS